MDVQLNAMDSFKLECLLGCAPERILTCTVEGACPELLPQWISQVPPGWNSTERLTVLKPGFSPAICAYCLLEDLENDQLLLIVREQGEVRLASAAGAHGRVREMLNDALQTVGGERRRR